MFTRVQEFMVEKLGVPRDQVQELQRQIFAKYNQNLRGLKAEGYQFDTNEFWSFIRPYPRGWFQPDPFLKSVMRYLNQIMKHNVVFTNCHEVQAAQALQVLDLHDCFPENRIYGAGFMVDRCKPEKWVFEKLIKELQAQPHECVMFEDNLKNLRTCKELGIITVYVKDPKADLSKDQHLEHYADYIIPDVSEAQIREALPKLWSSKEMFSSVG